MSAPSQLTSRPKIEISSDNECEEEKREREKLSEAPTPESDIPTSPSGPQEMDFEPPYISPNAAIRSIVKAFRKPLRKTLDTKYSEEKSKVTFTIDWAVQIAGSERFEYNEEDNRPVLRGSDELARHGVHAGLPEVILQWLKGGPEKLVMDATYYE